MAPHDQGALSGRPSQRYQLITKFLQEAARIVPMESIFFAIADCTSDITAIKCAEAVITSNTLIPRSKLMKIGCRKAVEKFISFHPYSYYRMSGGFLSPFSSNTRGFNMTDTDADIAVSSLTTPMHDYDDILSLHDVYQHGNYSRGSQYSFQHQFANNYSLKNQMQLSCGEETQSTVLLPPQLPRHSSSSLQYSTQRHANTSKTHKQLSDSEQTPLKVIYPSEQAVTFHASPSTLLSVRDFFIQLDRHLDFPTARDLICGRNIGETYPISECLSNTQSYNILKPLPVILREARQVLASLCVEHKASDINIGATSSGICEMLETVNSIIANNLEPCVAMLGGFMEQQIRIPLVNNPKDTAKAFATADTSGAVGVWALFALEKVDIVNILDTRRTQSLVLQITDFIHGALNADAAWHLNMDKLSSYDGKLQFLLQGMSETVTCSSHYISYSLERELVRLCEQLEITTSTNVDEVITTWDEKFNQTALALVPTSHRPLLARWLIWALNIYRLREGLAKYTTVGVIGLVNSGKSTLVKKLFQKEVSTIILFLI